MGNTKTAEALLKICHQPLKEWLLPNENYIVGSASVKIDIFLDVHRLNSLIGRGDVAADEFAVASSDANYRVSPDWLTTGAFAIQFVIHRGRKSNVMGHGSLVMGHGSLVMGHESWVTRLCGHI